METVGQEKYIPPSVENGSMASCGGCIRDGGGVEVMFEPGGAVGPEVETHGRKLRKMEMYKMRVTVQHTIMVRFNPMMELIAAMLMVYCAFAKASLFARRESTLPCFDGHSAWS